MKTFKFYRDKEELYLLEVTNWEYKRLIKVFKILYSMGAINNKEEINKLIKNKEIEKIRELIATKKVEFGLDLLKSKLKTKYSTANKFVKVLNFFSNNKRKSSVTEIVVKGTDLEAIDVLNKLNYIMLNNTEKNIKLNLKVNPDHYVLLGRENNIQEVIEVTGGAVLPTQFFVNYGDDSSLTSHKDPSFQEEIYGVCKLPDGTDIGGVRHQIKKEKDVLTVRLEVEFPKLTPNFVLKEHQLHLACEFGHWLDYIVNDKL